jgi:3-methyladenine DNA glycosylase/8-oxoguanine DNA glycosylase
MRAATLRSRCGVGYRDVRIVELARLFSKGEVDEVWLTDAGVSDEAVFKHLKGMPGIGPYGAANVMMLLGRYSRLAMDTECVKHGRAVLGMKGTDAAVAKRLHAHYEAFGVERFRSYWFELWTHHEKRNGAAWMWDRDGTGAGLTEG